MSSPIVGPSPAHMSIMPALPGLATVPTQIPTPVPAENLPYTVKLSDAAQAQQLESQGQSGSEIAAPQGWSLANIGPE